MFGNCLTGFELKIIFQSMEHKLNFGIVIHIFNEVLCDLTNN